MNNRNTDRDQVDIEEIDIEEIDIDRIQTAQGRKSQGHKEKGRREKVHKENIPLIHLIIWGIAVVMIIIAVAVIIKWNKGTKSDYDPDNLMEGFDVETNDYIQPLSSEQLVGKTDDGVTTILALGNSPFADNGDANNLTSALGATMNATVINGGLKDSYISQRNETISEDYRYDGMSLYQVAKALTTGDYADLKRYSKATSEEAGAVAERLSAVDMTSVDMIVIMYDLEEYIDHRPITNEGDPDDITTVTGALNQALGMIQDKYPYIRIVVLSTPASGKTIDDYYVDGDTVDLGYGNLTDYMGMEIITCVNRGVSFVDIYYGAINIDDRDKYLYDDYHINDEGAKRIAARVSELIR
jgi:hypothetical protein